MDKIRIQRAELILSDNPAMEQSDAFDQTTEFMLSIKANYHGERLTHTPDSIAPLIKHVIARHLDDAIADEQPAD